MKKVDISEIDIKNKEFWAGFFSGSYPNGYDERLDLSVCDITDEFVDMDWWDDFTGYTEEIFEENDGYLEEPTTLEVEMDSNRQLKIEFHPGDILYFINGNHIGSTGPHWKLQVFSFDEVDSFFETKQGEILFWLLLPLAKITDGDVDTVINKLEKRLERLFAADVCGEIARCLVNQLLEGNEK